MNITVASNEELAISFPYDPEIIAKIKTLPERRFDGVGKRWIVPSYLRENVMELFPEAEVCSEALLLTREKPKLSFTVVGETITISFPYDPETVSKVKSLSERKFVAKDKTWRVPARIANDLLAIFPEALQNLEIAQLVAKATTLSSMSNLSNSDFEITGLKGEPLPYQKAGVKFLELANGRAIIGDQMGLGKTLQSLGYLQINPTKRPAIIVVPASLKINWQREIDKWLSTPETTVIINGRKPTQIPGNTSIIIINYDILKAWKETLLLSEPQVIIFDEAHYLKNGKRQRSKAANKLAKEIPHCLLLTGTPILNRPAELFPLLNMVSPSNWPNFFSFARRYCNAHKNRFGWDFSGASHLDELHQKIKPFMVRRTKDQVLKELPPKRRVSIPIEMTAKERREYNTLLQQAIIAIKSSDQVNSKHLTMIEKSKQAAVRGKMPQAIDWIKNFLESDEKLIVFATHKIVVAELLQVFGDTAVSITGDSKQVDRQTAVDRFQNDDSIRLFVGNIQAAGVGLTLTAASDVAFLELGWTPGEHEQAEDRPHRIGQQNNVTIWYLLAQDTIDEDIFALINRKQETASQVIDGKATGLNVSIFKELAKRLKENMIRDNLPNSEEIISRSTFYRSSCGVYFLINGNDIVYIGQSHNTQKRISVHDSEKKKKFDRIFVIELPPQKLDQYELECILKYNPIHNKAICRGNNYLSLRELMTETNLGAWELRRISKTLGIEPLGWSKSTQTFTRKDLEKIRHYLANKNKRCGNNEL